MGSKIKLTYDRSVGEGERIYIIAEGGLTNWGDLELAKKQVDAAMAAGADAIKFQAQTTEELVSKKVNPAWYKRLKYKELSHDKLRELWRYCQIRNIDCFITAHTEIDLNFVDKELNVPVLKVGSGESTNYDFLKEVGSREKPVIISLGLHLNEEEIKQSINVLEDAGAKDIIILHCNTIYPTPPEINNLQFIKRLKEMFDYPIGYSDHTVGWHMPIAAAAMGASLIEKHLSFDKTDKRSLDCPGSCEPQELKTMVRQIREIDIMLRSSNERRLKKIEESRRWARQSIVAKCFIPKGTLITREMITFKRPGIGLATDKLGAIIGKAAARNIEYDELISEQNTQ